MGHRKVQCWIFSKNKSLPKCLLLKTIDTRGAYWQPVTGTVEPGEGYFEAACREPLEETGFAFDNKPSDIGYEFEFTSQYGVTREHVFALTVEGEPDPKLEPKEHQSFLWTEPQKAITMIKYESNREGLKKSYEAIFGKELRDS